LERGRGILLVAIVCRMRGKRGVGGRREGEPLLASKSAGATQYSALRPIVPILRCEVAWQDHSAPLSYSSPWL
jgi:hypothetical protein